MNYQVITDRMILQEFISWLPELEEGETYYVSLLARKKYCREIRQIRSDKQQLKRFTSVKEFLYEKIQQLEVPLDHYYQKHIPIPQEALALYININPRSMIKATRTSMTKLASLNAKPYNGFNPHQEVMSEIQKCCSRKIFLDIDFDEVSVDEVHDQIVEAINVEAINYVHTRGGFHALINLKKINKDLSRTWHNKIMQIKGVDIKGDNMIPVPGTYQGGFTPYIKSCFIK
jgi:hypothetical protein